MPQLSNMLLLIAAIAWASPCMVAAEDPSDSTRDEAEENDGAQTKDSTLTEDQIWAMEEKELAQCCGKGVAKYHRSLVGVVTIEKDTSAGDENIGKFTAEGKTYILRAASAELVSALRDVPEGKSIVLNGKLRGGAKYFVAEGISFTLPGDGVSTPAIRRKRGSI